MATEKQKQYARKYYEAHRAEIIARAQAYREANREHVREVEQARYKRCRDEILQRKREYNKRYYAMHKEQIAARNSLKRDALVSYQRSRRAVKRAERQALEDKIRREFEKKIMR